MDNLDMKALQVEFDALDETVRWKFGTFENFVSYKNAGAGQFFADPVYCFNDSNANVSVETAAEFDEQTASDDVLKEHFAKSHQLEDEFHNVEAYVAYIHYDRRRRDRFGQRRSSIGTETVDGFDEARATDQQLRDHFSETECLQNEFSDCGSYLAYVRFQRMRREKGTRRGNRRDAREGFGARRRESVEST